MIPKRLFKKDHVYILSFALMMFLIAVAFINLTAAQHYDFNQPKGQFTMEITGNPKKEVQQETNLTVVKVVDPSNGRLQYRYDIITPPVDDFHFVLALDSSSSLKASSNSDEAKAVITAVPNFIDDTILRHSDKNFYLSVVSWDDNVDFASGPFTNSDPRNAKLVKIGNVSKEIKNQRIFGKVNDTGYKYSCLDEDHTNLSVPISAAINILDSNPPIKYHRTQNFTILVIGDGEYTKCNEKLIRDSQDKGYAVYVVLVDYSKSSDLFSYLQNITGDPSRVFTCVADDKTLEENLRLQLNSALEKAISEPAAQDVVLYDHFDDFIPPGTDASIEIVGFSGTRRAITPIFTNNSIRIEVPGGLWAENVTRIMLDARIDLRNLSTSGNNFAAKENELGNNSRSTLSYYWLRERYPFELELPECSVNITGPIFADDASTSTATQPVARRGIFDFKTLLSSLLRV